jgi:hypothetical protein
MQNAQAAAPVPQPAPPQQAGPGAKPPAVPGATQSTLQPPAIPLQQNAQGQSTLATFAGASAQQGAASAAPAGTSVPPAQQTQPSAAQQMPMAPPQQPPAQTAKPANALMKFLPIIAFIMILAAAGAYYVFVMAPAGSPPTPSTPLPNPGQNITVSNQLQQAAGPIDCGTDIACFAKASSACQAANVTRNLTYELLGMLVSGATYMEMQSAPESGKCVLYSRTVDSSAKFSDATIAAALAKGISIGDIKKQEAEAARQAKATIGLSGTCKYGTAGLAAVLNRWAAGKFASSDYSGAECSGKMFEGVNPNGGFSANLTLQNASSGVANASIKANTTVKANTSIKANSSVSSTNRTNATGAAKTNTTSGTTTASPPPAAANATNTTVSQTFAYSRRYTSYYPELLSRFCADRGTEFYHMHYQEYFGGGCSVAKPKDGLVSLGDYTATGCALLPCCQNGPYSEYSRSYDYFECGYN